MFAVVLLGERVDKVGNLEKISHILENLAGLTETAEPLIDQFKDVHRDEKEGPRKKIVKTLTKDVYNEFGNKENQREKPGRSYTKAEGSGDSTSKNGDTLYMRIKRWKKTSQ